MIATFRIGMFVCVLLLAACGGATPSTGGQPAVPAATATQADQSPAASAQAQPDATSTAGGQAEGVFEIAVLTRSGGLQGLTETLLVLSDGTLRVIEGDISGQPLKEAKTTPDRIDRLSAALQSEDWQNLEATYGEPTPDAYTYTIIANAKTVTTYDGAQMPAVLEAVLAQLNELWQEALKG